MSYRRPIRALALVCALALPSCRRAPERVALDADMALRGSLLHESAPCRSLIACPREGFHAYAVGTGSDVMIGDDGCITLRLGTVHGAFACVVIDDFDAVAIVAQHGDPDGYITGAGRWGAWIQGASDGRGAEILVVRARRGRP